MNSELQGIDDIIHLVNKIGLELSEELHKKEQFPQFIVTFDLLARINQNCKVLRLICNSNTTNVQTPKNLIYRSIFTDLMLALHLLSSSPSEFNDAISCLDIDHVKYMKEAFEMRLYVARKLFKSCPKNDSPEQDLYNKYYDLCKAYLNSNKGEPWEIVQKPKCKQNSFNGTIKSLYNCLKEKHDNDNLKALANLYMYYKYYSQTEHYSVLGKGYSLIDEANDSWKLEVNYAIESALDELQGLIKDTKE